MIAMFLIKLNFVDLLFSQCLKFIGSANTTDNFFCVRSTPLHSFTFLLSSYPLIRFYFMTPEAEKFNGWMAMIGFIAAFGAYATTGQIIPGIFQVFK